MVGGVFGPCGDVCSVVTFCGGWGPSLPGVFCLAKEGTEGYGRGPGGGGEANETILV